MSLIHTLTDVILTKRAINRIKSKLSEMGENPELMVLHEQDICGIIHSISIRAKFKFLNNCDRFHKENGIQLCFALITRFNDSSNVVQESIVLLILKYLYLDEKRGMFTTANAIQNSICKTQLSQIERICELHGENEDIFQLSQVLLNAVSRAKENQCLQLLEYMEHSILFDVHLHIFRRLRPPPRGIEEMFSRNLDELEILVQETMAHSSKLAVLKRGMSVLMKLIHTRNLFSRDSSAQVHESIVDTVSKLLVLAIECEDFDTQLIAFSIITRSSDDFFASNVEVACSVLSFLTQSDSNLHFLAIIALSMCCNHEDCIRELEIKGLKSFLHDSLYRNNYAGSKTTLPLNLKLLYTKQELVQEGLVGTPTYAVNTTERKIINSELEPTIFMRSVPEYGTVNNIFEQGETGLF